MFLLQGCLNQSHLHLDLICGAQGCGGVSRLSPSAGGSTSSQAQGKWGKWHHQAPQGNVLHFSAEIIHLLFSFALPLFLLKTLGSKIQLHNSPQCSRFNGKMLTEGLWGAQGLGWPFPTEFHRRDPTGASQSFPRDWISLYGIYTEDKSVLFQKGRNVR